MARGWKDPKDNFYAQHWAEKRQQYDRSKARGEVMVWTKGGRLHVSAPNDPEFRIGALAIDGVFRAKTGIWSFDVKRSPELGKLIHTRFGAAWVPSWMSGEPDVIQS